MALLKKIKAATLMETMVATVLIVVIFMMTSMLLNTIFSTTIENNTIPVQERLHELEYEFSNGKIIAPYVEEWQQWEITIVPISSKASQYYQFEATHQKSGKTSTSYVYEKD